MSDVNDIGLLKESLFHKKSGFSSFSLLTTFPPEKCVVIKIGKIASFDDDIKKTQPVPSPAPPQQ